MDIRVLQGNAVPRFYRSDLSRQMACSVAHVMLRNDSTLIKGLITVGRELRQQHSSDLLSESAARDRP